MTAIIDITKTTAYRKMARRAIEVHREVLIEMGFDPDDDEEQFALLAWMVRDWEED